MLAPQTLLFALLGGIFPALFWLWFWLKEDEEHPEPRKYIMLALITGMICVPLVIPLEQITLVSTSGIITVIAWAAIEETMKYGAGVLVILRKKVVDEPLDPIIYMITIALGFSALENTLFLLNPHLDLFGGIITGSLRFIGATLLHTLASATVGVGLAFSFYDRPSVKWKHGFFALILAILLHTLFNFFIINSNGDRILTVFAFVWVGIILLLLLFEKVKRITNVRFRR